MNAWDGEDRIRIRKRKDIDAATDRALRDFIKSTHKEGISDSDMFNITQEGK